MCAACVAQGITYVGGAVTGLQVMAYRAKQRRLASEQPEAEPEKQPVGASLGKEGA